MKKILIPIKVEKPKDLPLGNGEYLTIYKFGQKHLLTISKEARYAGYDPWFDVEYWYKEVTIDELFPTTKELNKPNDSVEWMCGAVWAINYIKQKLEG